MLHTDVEEEIDEFYVQVQSEIYQTCKVYWLCLKTGLQNLEIRNSNKESKVGLGKWNEAGE